MRGAAYTGQSGEPRSSYLTSSSQSRRHTNLPDLAASPTRTASVSTSVSAVANTAITALSTKTIYSLLHALLALLYGWTWSREAEDSAPAS